MKVRQNYTLDLRLIERLNNEVRNQFKSQFVEKAIRVRLDGLEAFTLGDMTDIQLLNILLSRNWKRDGTNSLDPVLFAAIKMVLESNS